MKKRLLVLVLLGLAFTSVGRVYAYDSDSGGFGSSDSGGFSSSDSGGFGSSDSGGFGSSDSGGFGSSDSGGFGSSDSGGFGSSDSGGFGSSDSGGFGSSDSGGFGSSDSGGFGSSDSGGFGSSDSGGFGSSDSGGFSSSDSGGFGSSDSGGFGSSDSGGFGSSDSGGFGSSDSGSFGSSDSDSFGSSDSNSFGGFSDTNDTGSVDTASYGSSDTSDFSSSISDSLGSNASSDSAGFGSFSDNSSSDSSDKSGNWSSISDSGWSDESSGWSSIGDESPSKDSNSLSDFSDAFSSDSSFSSGSWSSISDSEIGDTSLSNAFGSLSSIGESSSSENGGNWSTLGETALSDGQSNSSNWSSTSDLNSTSAELGAGNWTSSKDSVASKASEDSVSVSDVAAGGWSSVSDLLGESSSQSNFTAGNWSNVSDLANDKASLNTSLSDLTEGDWSPIADTVSDKLSGSSTALNDFASGDWTRLSDGAASTSSATADLSDWGVGNWSQVNDSLSNLSSSPATSLADFATGGWTRVNDASTSQISTPNKSFSDLAIGDWVSAQDAASRAARLSPLEGEYTLSTTKPTEDFVSTSPSNLWSGFNPVESNWKQVDTSEKSKAVSYPTVSDALAAWASPKQAVTDKEGLPSFALDYASALSAAEKSHMPGTFLDSSWQSIAENKTAETNFLSSPVNQVAEITSQTLPTAVDLDAFSQTFAQTPRDYYQAGAMFAGPGVTKSIFPDLRVDESSINKRVKDISETSKKFNSINPSDSVLSKVDKIGNTLLAIGGAWAEKEFSKSRNSLAKFLDQPEIKDALTLEGKKLSDHMGVTYTPSDVFNPVQERHNKRIDYVEKRWGDLKTAVKEGDVEKSLAIIDEGKNKAKNLSAPLLEAVGIVSDSKKHYDSAKKWKDGLVESKKEFKEGYKEGRKERVKNDLTQPGFKTLDSGLPIDEAVIDKRVKEVSDNSKKTNRVLSTDDTLSKMKKVATTLTTIVETGAEKEFSKSRNSLAKFLNQPEIKDALTLEGKKLSDHMGVTYTPSDVFNPVQERHNKRIDYVEKRWGDLKTAVKEGDVEKSLAIIDEGKNKAKNLSAPLLEAIGIVSEPKKNYDSAKKWKDALIGSKDELKKGYDKGKRVNMK